MRRAEAIILTGLAAYRAASLIVDEDGPGDLFGRVRALAERLDMPRRKAAAEAAVNRGLNESWNPVFVEMVRINTMDQPSKGSLAAALACTWCVSVWAAALLSPRKRPLDVLAAAGVAVVLDRVERLTRDRANASPSE